MDNEEIKGLKYWAHSQEEHFLQIGYKGVNIDLFRHLLPIGGGLILDVGCGFGDWVNEIYHLGEYVVIGIDMPGVITKAKEKYPELAGNFFPHNLEFEDIPIVIDRDTLIPGYNLILCLGVIEHIIRYERLFGLMADALAPGGYLYLTTCNNEARILEEWHFHHFDEQELTTLALQNNLTPVEFKRTSPTNLQATFRRDR